MSMCDIFPNQAELQMNQGDSESVYLNLEKKIHIRDDAED